MMEDTKQKFRCKKCGVMIQHSFVGLRTGKKMFLCSGCLGLKEKTIKKRDKFRRRKVTCRKCNKQDSVPTYSAVLLCRTCKMFDELKSQREQKGLL